MKKVKTTPFLLRTRLASVTTECEVAYTAGVQTHRTRLVFNNGTEVTLVSSNGALHNEYSQRMVDREEFEIMIKSSKRSE